MATAYALASPVRRVLLYPALLVFLVVLAVSRYEPTSFVFRNTNEIDAFGWFWRYRVLGAIGFFDAFLAVLVGLLLLDAVVRNRWKPSRFDPLVMALLALVVLASLVGTLHRGPLDGPRELLFQLRNYGYLAAAYFVASRVAWTERRYRAAMLLLVVLAATTVGLGYWETALTPPSLRVWKGSRYLTLRDIADTLFIVFAQFWLLGLLFERAPRSLGERLLVVSGIAWTLHQTLTGVGKTLLFVYPAVLLYFAWHHRLHRRRFVPALAALGGLAAAAGWVAVASRPAPLAPAPRLEDYGAVVMQDLSVATRVLQTWNFAANLYERSALLQGIGVGSKWYEYAPQPFDFAAYPPAEQGTSWHLGMHTPLLRVGLDFGLAGLAVVLGLFALVFQNARAALRAGTLAPATRAFVQASLLAIAFQLTVNNLAGPKTNLLAGCLLGALGGLLDHAHPRPAARAARERGPA